MELTLDRVKIQNFRSIEEMEIETKKDLKILVGRNESGKSNILLALSALRGELGTKSNNMVRMNTNSNSPSQIIFTMHCDARKLFEEIKGEFLSERFKMALLKKFKKLKNINIEYCYNVRTGKATKTILDDIWVDEEYDFIKSQQGNVMLNLMEGGDEVIINTDLHSIIVDGEKYQDNSIITKASKEKINEIVAFIVKQKITIPKVLYWKYSKDFIIPSYLNTEEFINDPQTCTPLLNAFKAIGYDDIRREYEDKKSQGELAWQNFLRESSRKINDYMADRWKTPAKLDIDDYGGSQISVAIRDDEANRIELASRSDGYLRMFTFIVMISALSTSNELKNTLILIDEPDVMVDLPGQKQLLEELIRLAQNNYVMISTHSPSMIDTKNIGRHVIVEKKHNTTTFTGANEDNYSIAETLYKGLGMEYYSKINNADVVFEGRSDKLVFDKYVRANHKELINAISATFTGGVDSFSNFATLWMTLVGNSKKLLLVSDDDQKALSNRKKYMEKGFLEPEWMTYSELVGGEKITEVEDFLEPLYVKNAIEKVIKKTIADYKSILDVAKLEDNMSWGEQKQKINGAIHEYCNVSGEQIDKTELNKKIKEKLFEDLKPSDIKQSYETFFVNIMQKLNIGVNNN